MKALRALILTLGFSFAALASIPPSRFIATEWVKNAGSGVYQIEQDVQFPTSGEPLVLRETWWVMNENLMRLQVTGLRELKDQFHLQYIYENGQRFGLTPQGRMGKKAGDDFIEKYFHFRSAERLLNDLISLKVLTSQALARKNWRTSKEVEYHPEPLVRLSRTGGVVSYAFGTPSPVEGSENPGFWIEEDAFVLRKFRLPSSVEVTAEKFVPSSKGLIFPRQRVVRYGSNTVQIQTLSVVARNGIKPDFFAPGALNSTNRMDGIDDAALKSTVEDFYLRFR